MSDRPTTEAPEFIKSLLDQVDTAYWPSAPGGLLKFRERITGSELSDFVKPIVRQMSEAERLEFIGSLGVCVHCGSFVGDSFCYCMHDE